MYQNVTLSIKTKTAKSGTSYDILVITLANGYQIESYDYNTVKALQDYKRIAESFGVEIK